jgi:hypothetical protein
MGLALLPLLPLLLLPSLRRVAAEAGVQSESATFAAWEDSGRGIASKLLARMGFKRGAGLGKQGVYGAVKCAELLRVGRCLHAVCSFVWNLWAGPQHWVAGLQRAIAGPTCWPETTKELSIVLLLLQGGASRTHLRSQKQRVHASACKTKNCATAAAAAVAAAAGRGIKDPLEITVLSSKRGVGAAPKHKTHKAAGTGAASSQHHGKLSGRKRKRMKAAAARHAAKAGDRQRQAQMEASTGEQGLFAFINDSLGHGSEAAAKLQAAGVYGPEEPGSSKQRQQTGGGAALSAAAAAAAAAGGSSSSRGAGGSQQQQQQQQSDRKGLVGSQDDLSALKVCLCWDERLR